MALVASDWKVNTDKTIQYIGAAHGAAGAGYVTVLELHRWLQDLADDASSAGDDYMDITRDTPTDKAYDTIITLQNGYTMYDDTSAEHIYGGSIIQGGASTTIWDGMQVIAPKGTHMEIIQNGSIIANDFWNNTPNGSSYKGINPDHANGISHQFMLKVRNAGTDIDGRRFIAITREFGKQYGERKVNGTGRGVNVIALPGGEVNDLNNSTAEGTVSGWGASKSIVNVTSGYVGINVNGGPYYFYSEWDKGSGSISDLYEWLKYKTRRGETTTMYGLQGQMFRGITHEVDVTTPRSGTVNEGVSASWPGGTGQVLARNSGASATKLWIQLLTGVAPVAGETITVGAASVTAAAGTPSTERDISAPFCGVSTGTNIIGSYGFGIQSGDLTVGDKVFDLTNTQRTPPNQVTFIVGNLDGSAPADYVLVGPYDQANDTIDYDQLTLNTSLTADNITSVVVTTTIPTDTPTSGYIRVQDNNGKYRRLHYSSYVNSTFTIDTTDGNEDFASVNATAPKNVFISYIDKEAASTTEQFQTNYVSPRNLYIRVRHGDSGAPIKTFGTSAGLPSSGSATVNVTRISDA